MTLLHQWKLDETSGTAIADSAGSNNGTAARNASLLHVGAGNGPGGSLANAGFDLDYLSPDYITIGSVVSFNPPVSFSYWCKPVDYGSNTVVFGNLDSFSDGHNVYLGASSGELRPGLRVQTSSHFPPSGTNLADGNWHHVLVRYNQSDSKHKIYVDGTLEADWAAGYITTVSVTTLPRIGSRNYTSPDQHYNGLLADFRVYNSDEAANVASIIDDARPTAATPVIVGSGQTGVQLTASSSTNDATATASWKWYRYPTLTDANNNTNGTEVAAVYQYTPPEADKTLYLRASVEYTNTGGALLASGRVYSAPLQVYRVVAKTIGTTGDYTTISAWEADLDNGAVYETGDWAVGQCLNETHSGSVTINGGTTIDLQRIVLTSHPDARHTGVADTGAKVTGIVTVSLSAVGVEDAIVEWLDITTTAGNGIVMNLSGWHGTILWAKNNLVHGMNNVGGSQGITGGNFANIRAVQNVVYYLRTASSAFTSRNSIGINLNVSGPGDDWIHQNTVHDIQSLDEQATTGAGIWMLANISCKNNLVTGVVSTYGTALCYNMGSTHTYKSNNASEDATAPGADSLINLDPADIYVSTVLGSEDLRLKAGAPVIGMGATLTAASGAQFDIDGYDRIANAVTWDIGADQYVAAGGSHSLTADPLTSGTPTLGSPALAQNHSISAPDLTGGTIFFESPTVSQNHAFTASALTSGTPVLDSPALGQAGDLTANPLSAGTPTLASPALNQTHVFTASALSAGSPTLGSPVLNQTHVLTASPLAAGSPTLASPALNQVHVLTAPTAISSGAPTLASPSLNQTHVLTANPLSSGVPELASPVLGQPGQIAANPLSTGSPTLGTPSLSQVHVSTANALSASAPTLASPALSQVHVLGTDGASAGSPTLGSPALSVVHNLVPSALSSGTPVLDSPILGIDGLMTALPLDAGTPTLDSPALSQVHVLSLVALSTGLPTLPTPLLNWDQIPYTPSYLRTFYPPVSLPERTVPQISFGNRTFALPYYSGRTFPQVPYDHRTGIPNGS